MKLSEIIKTEPFQPPAGYLDSLGKRISANTIQKKQTHYLDPIWKATGIAAAITLFAVSFFWGETEKPTASELLSEVTSEDLSIYLMESEIEDDLLTNDFSGEFINLFLETPLNQIDFTNENLIDLEQDI